MQNRDPTPFGSCRSRLTSRPFLQSALEEFLKSPRTNNSRVDLFTVCRKEGDGFDRTYKRGYDGDLNTFLILVCRPTSLCSQLCVYHRHSIQAGTRPERDNRRLHASPYLRPKRFTPSSLLKWI
ncbi:hypothetical protein BDM02DRAFT_1760488 [Thelephora ganbajun]|uniref:Uncharacterized protein n=1 Tax=Thelephora ganbajun TaxID=370292 RepID=A0ACB6Z189_THEGA|nr:hypothetical protein BDM02DRAFT_1760488 [Thelephora ganbajun]